MKRGKAANRLLDYYFGIPVLNLLASARCKGQYPEPPHRIGLLFNPALGDTLLASAATQDVRGLFPEAKLILFATTANVEAAKLLPEVDAIEMLPITRPRQAIRILRQSDLDLMLDFTAWQRITAIYSLLSKARYTVGFRRRKQYRHRGYDQTVDHRGDCHELENLRRLTASLGVRTHAAPRLVIPSGSVPGIVSSGGEVVVFHPWASGARSWLREWPDDRWTDLAHHLMAPHRTFVLTGSPTDEARCHKLCEKIVETGASAQCLIGRDGIGEVARLLQRAALLFSVNTGIMHLGAILGTPTVSINGPTSARRWGPVGPNVANVCPPDGSGGFLDLGFEYRGNAVDVMSRISVTNVVAAMQQLQRTLAIGCISV